MIYTARQLEDLWKANGANGQLVLPYRARLSPLAADWVKAKKVAVGYSDNGAPKPPASLEPVSAPAQAPAGAYLWWCDGACGTAKAALMGVGREAALSELGVPSDSSKLVSVIKQVASEVKTGKTAGGILMVQAGASAMVYANRCPSLRAVIGTCLETVEQGIQQVAANVLVIEYPHKTLQQMKNMLGRFMKGRRELSEEVRRQLQELASCG